MSDRLKLAVLISGSGSNLQAIIDAIESGTLNAEISLVVSNRPDAYGIERARNHGLAFAIINHEDYDSREAFDASLARRLQPLSPDYIVLAGFMRILGADFVAAYPNRILNIHPSLLPAYKGLNTHERALENGEAAHGVSIHLVTAELDDGPILLQGSYPIHPGDRVEDLQARGHALEHRMYPQLLGWISERKLCIESDGRILYDQARLEHPVVFDR